MLRLSFNFVHIIIFFYYVQNQEELDDMSEFLVLKSTEEQKEEGVERPVDTAYIEDRDGMPVLKAVFDVHHFTPDQVHITITDDNHLILEAGRLL